MYTYPFARPSVTATVALFYNDKILLGKRWQKTRAYPGCWGLPGGFLDAKSKHHPGETIETTAVREVYEETGIKIEPHELNLVCVNSNPNTDPRGHTVNILYAVVLNEPQYNMACAGDDCEEIVWVSEHEAHGLGGFERVIGPNDWAFNHGYDLFPKAFMYYNINLQKDRMCHC